MSNVQSIEDTVKIGRAWNNKLDNINELLSWMYEEDILNKTEKAEKDRTFRAYYRYYNDGDQPRGIAHADKEWTRKYLENSVNEFIAKILTKKQGKYSRADFRKSRKIDQLRTLERLAADFDCHALFTHFAPKVKFKGQTAFDYFYMSVDQAVYEDISRRINLVIADFDQSHLESYEQVSDSYVLSYRISQLEKYGVPIPHVTQGLITKRSPLRY